MKAAGPILLVLGLIGLTLSLVLWLPVKFSPALAVLIGIVCMAAVWGGGRLSQPKVGIVAQPSEQFAPPPLQDKLSLTVATFCPKCGCQIVPGQQWCGSCGSSLTSYCARCGEPIGQPSRFCGKCGARLG